MECLHNQTARFYCMLSVNRSGSLVQGGGSRLQSVSEIFNPFSDSRYALESILCPLCAALCFDRLVRIRSLSRAAKAGALFSLLPLVCLGLLMLYWGGKQPPAYIDPLPSAISIGWRSRLAQFALGAISVGAWVGALLFEYRLHKRSFFSP